MGTPPLPQHFPARNRVIAGLALGTVVVEAAERSGALITARLAGEMGREVYAVPGNVSSPVSQGTNDLLRDGASFARSWEDVVAELAPAWRAAVGPGPAPAATPAVVAGAPAAGGGVLALLGEDPLAIDHVIERSGLAAGAVAASLTELELSGHVRKLPWPPLRASLTMARKRSLVVVESPHQGEDHPEIPGSELRGEGLARARAGPPDQQARRGRGEELQAPVRDAQDQGQGPRGPEEGRQGGRRALHRDRPGPRGRGDRLARGDRGEGPRRPRLSRDVQRDHRAGGQGRLPEPRANSMEDREYRYDEQGRGQ